MSEVDDLGTGLIILCFQKSEVMLKSKHILKRTVNRSASLFFFITSAGRLSIPADVLFFIAFIAPIKYHNLMSWRKTDRLTMADH